MLHLLSKYVHVYWIKIIIVEYKYQVTFHGLILLFKSVTFLPFKYRKFVYLFYKLKLIKDMLLYYLFLH